MEMVMAGKAKFLSYFKYTPSLRQSKNIVLCSMAAQGLFANILDIYWINTGKLNIRHIQLRFPDNNKELEELIAEDIIKVENNFISISFLDEQFEAFSVESKRNSANANARWGNVRVDGKRAQSDCNATALRPQSDCNAVAIYKRREEKKREEKKRKENTRKEKSEERKKKEEIEFDKFFKKYNKTMGHTEQKRKATYIKWKSLTNVDKQKAYDNIEPFYNSRSDSQKKDTKYIDIARSYLSGSLFDDEFTTNNKSTFYRYD